MSTTITSTRRTKWWKCSKSDLPSAVWGWSNAVAAANDLRLSKNRRYRQLYQRIAPDGTVSGVNPSGWSQSADGGVKYNLVSSCVDSLASVVAQLKPLPKYQLDVGAWGLGRIARARTRVLDSLYAELKIHDVGSMVFLGAATSDFGAAYVFRDPLTGKPNVQLVNSYELDIDVNEAMYGRPPTVMRRHFVDRDKLKGAYKKSWIDEASSPGFDDFERFFMSSDTQADLVKVVEAWHLPSFPGADDGRHVLCTDNGVLVDEPYTSERHRFAFYSWKRNVTGSIFGTSIAEEVLPAQLEINEHIKRVREQQLLMSVGRVLVHKSSGVVPSKITNFPGQVYMYSGEKPDWHLSQGTPMDLQDQIERVENRVYKQLGLSPSSVQGTREIGINSGAGQRTMQDIRSARHVLNSRAFIRFYMDLSERLIDVLDEIADNDEDFVVNALVARGAQVFLDETNWHELALPEGKARFTIADVSNTPTTPQGRLEQIEDFLRMGFIDRRSAMRALELAETNVYVTLETSTLEYALWQAERLADGEVVFPPDIADLALCSEVATKSALAAEIGGAPPEVLWNFRNYIRACDAKLAKSQPPPAPAAPPPSAAPVQGSPV